MNTKGWYELKISIHGVKTLNAWGLGIVIAVKASEEWRQIGFSYKCKAYVRDE